MASGTIKILNEDIPVGNERICISQLNFLKNNPRVYACTHGQPGFENMDVDQQQQAIFNAIQREPSVTNLRRDLEHHGGLLEPILVRMDTMEVIEGNSRLAAYRLLHKKQPNGKWSEIECSTVSSLTDKQQDAFLNQMHVKGKTKWSAYEKANFAFVRSKNGYSFKDMTEIFNESEPTLRRRVKIIQRMAGNEDREQSNFSFYDVIERNREISKPLDSGQHIADLVRQCKLNAKELNPSQKKNLKFHDWLLQTVKSSDKEFTAQELRKQLPVVLKKPKVLKRLIEGKIKLEDAYTLATVSKAQAAVRHATEVLQDISATEVKKLEANSLNALKQDVRKLRRAYDRIEKITERSSAG